MRSVDAAIALSAVTKTFGAKTAVDSLDLVVPSGALYGFIGPNGAGKTTSIRMIMSILLPDSGRLAVLGHERARDAKDRIGYLPEERGVYRKMKVGSFLSYMGRLKGMRRPAIAKRVDALLETVELGAVKRHHCWALSKGMSQKLQFLAAIVHEPDLLILDEPFSGLDPVGTRQLRDLVLAEHGRGATILFSTHAMVQAEELCQHVVMIHEGRKMLDEPVQAIRRRYDPRTVDFEPLDAASDMGSIDRIAEVQSVLKVEDRYEIVLVEGADPGAALRAITAAVAPARIELYRPRLEDIFMRIVSESQSARIATPPCGDGDTMAAVSELG